MSRVARHRWEEGNDAACKECGAKRKWLGRQGSGPLTAYMYFDGATGEYFGTRAPDCIKRPARRGRRMRQLDLFGDVAEVLPGRLPRSRTE